MYGAMAVETLTTGMGTGAFSVLLLRLTQKRFSATQYALLSSVFALGRTVAGPMAGVMVDAMGWTVFFVVTIFAAVPGLLLLQRFVPVGVRDPVFEAEPPSAGPVPGRGPLALRAAGGFFGGLLTGALCSALLDAARGLRSGHGFDVLGGLARLASPSGIEDTFTLLAVLLFAAVCGVGWAALAAARGVKS
jgi:PAT family beta-lactamase induction signal transducer AmpG